jgi:uncharacterized damage-inducible protein DinB
VIEIMADAFYHHSWANLRLLDACEPLSQEQLAAPVPGIYGNVLDTFRHIVGADAWYLFVLTGGNVPQVEEDTLAFGELRAVMERHAENWREVLRTDPEPDTVVVAHRDDGSEGHSPASIRLAQAIHHGTDHRSQICTALTTLGIEPPEIDVWAYGEELGKVREVSPPVV